MFRKKSKSNQDTVFGSIDSAPSTASSCSSHTQGPIIHDHHSLLPADLIATVRKKWKQCPKAVQVVVATALFIIIMLGLRRGFLFINPDRCVGYTAWFAHLLMLMLVWIVGLVVFATLVLPIFGLLYRKYRSKPGASYKKLTSKDKKLCVFGAITSALIVSAALVMSSSVCMDIYEGPSHRTIAGVSAYDQKISVATGRFSRSSVPVKHIVVQTLDGPEVTLDLRLDEWEQYRSQLVQGESFTYYTRSNIWMPSLDR